jgi:hypothetical protein
MKTFENNGTDSCKAKKHGLATISIIFVKQLGGMSNSGHPTFPIDTT